MHPEVPCQYCSAVVHDRIDNKMALPSEEQMRHRLQFYFMNPIEKWHARRKFPYKFVAQLVKVVLVTAQLSLFAYSRYQHVNYTDDSVTTFSHLFLRGWDSTREVKAYPPATGPLAIYEIDDFYKAIDYAYSGYSHLGNAVGQYSYANEDNTREPLELCLWHFKKGIIFGFNESYVFDAKIIQECFNFSTDHMLQTDGLLDSRQYFNDNISFATLVRATIGFSLKTVNLRGPNCYRFDVRINFDNADHDGQMLFGLDADATRLQCKGDVHYIRDNRNREMLCSQLNIVVICVCFMSLVLCVRAVWRAQQLRHLTDRYFRINYRRPLAAADRRKFLNLWYCMIIVNDLLIISGTVIKEQIESKQFTSDHWNVCSLLLGLGNMLVWFGVLRYLGFFKTYNVVMLTLERSTPQIFRFLICALLIYAAYAFSGWLILGPYHLKFRSLATTCECLFSLINGDDMFATFSIMSDRSRMLWWFSRAYLYSFISLYIYIILSLFIAVIMDAYDTIKLYYTEGFPKSDLLEFVYDGSDYVNSVRVDSSRSRSGGTETTIIERCTCGGRQLQQLLFDLCCCCGRQRHTYSSVDGLDGSSAAECTATTPSTAILANGTTHRG